MKANNFQVLLKQYPHAIVLGLNCNAEPFNNIKARLALQYAIDKDSMCNALLNHCGTPAYQWMYPGHPWFNQEVGKRGSGNRWPPPMMELIQQNFKAIGVELTTVPVEWVTLTSMSRAGLASGQHQIPRHLGFAEHRLTLQPQ